MSRQEERGEKCVCVLLFLKRYFIYSSMCTRPWKHTVRGKYSPSELESDAFAWLLYRGAGI